MTPNPHTGKLTAIVRDLECSFDGNAWSTPDQSLTDDLNQATRSTPKTHTDIRELAEIVLRKLNLWADARLTVISRDEWKGQVPPDAIE